MRLRLLSLAACSLFTGSCFQAWQLTGLYQCGGGCPEGWVCDDNVCCVPGGAPECPTLVPPSGVCAGGLAPKVYFLDEDGDTFGSPATARMACSRPLSSPHPYVDNGDDCDDGSAAARPGGSEACDGRDNNCNSTIDEGQSPLQPYYRDTDGDRYGDSNDTVMACACAGDSCTPPGFSTQGGDCALSDPARHPGAQELCNGLDDDCNNQPDDGAVVGVGGACTGAGMGLCAPGTFQCVTGMLTCVSTYVPSLDLCDGLDNDCDGMTDERPDCGGPDHLFDNVSLSVTAQRINAVFSDTTSRCLKGFNITGNDAWVAPTWSGSTSQFHVLAIEAPGVTTWDLSTPNTRLDFRFTYTMLFPGSPTAWSPLNQPIVYLCEGGLNFNRYVFAGMAPNYGPINVNNTNGDSNTQSFPLAGGGGWVLGAGSSSNLKRIRRIEFLVKPEFSSTMPPPQFTLDFFPTGGFRPP